MQRARLQTGQLFEAFGRPSGGGGEQHLGTLGPGEGHDGTHGKALATPRATGQHRDLLGQRQLDGLHLGRRQGAARLGRQPVEGDLPVDRLEGGQPLLASGEQLSQAAGERHLGAVEGHQIDSGERCGRGLWGCRLRDEHFANDTLPTHQGIETGLHQRGVDPEDLGGACDEVRFGQVAMALLGGGGERELQPGLEPLGTVVGDAQALGDLVRRLEADAPDIGG